MKPGERRKKKCVKEGIISISRYLRVCRYDSYIPTVPACLQRMTWHQWHVESNYIYHTCVQEDASRSNLSIQFGFGFFFFFMLSYQDVGNDMIGPFFSVTTCRSTLSTKGTSCESRPAEGRGVNNQSRQILPVVGHWTPRCEF